MSPAKIRSEVIKLSKLSVKQPDYYFIQGYFLGLGLLPDMIMPNQWQADLLGEINFTSDTELKYLESLMANYNNSMQKVMSEDFKMPTKCSLSKTDYRDSLKANMPLPNYCKGALQALKFINKRSLDKSQKEVLASLNEILNAFSSEQAAVKKFASNQGLAQSFKKNYVYFVADALYNIRFIEEPHWSDEDEAAFNDQFAHQQHNDEFAAGKMIDDETIEQLMEAILSDFTPRAFEPIEALLELFEGVITEQYIAQNQGHFWLIHETRPYMALRAHRAQINALQGNIQPAIDELETLLQLNPMDNQANRHWLMNCYIIKGQWQKLDAFLADFDSEELHATASRALSEFHKNGDSSQAKQYKKKLKQLNKHFIKILTGQEKLKNEGFDFYSPGSKEEVALYLHSLGKQAWIAAEGSLFWLRKKL
ncbi:bacterial transcriptional activator domain-containing protein [uncultured Pseudoalteromonas sp.]|uniref:bacterial transcriptional activator domain-containing protein n=1 Tax=uncultured Pseudoalteromonas sp. TaxID=114053 RepID=UPI0030C86674